MGIPGDRDRALRWSALLSAWLLLLPTCIKGFSPNSRCSIFHASPVSRSSRLQLSLNDEWVDLTSRLATRAGGKGTIHAPVAPTQQFAFQSLHLPSFDFHFPNVVNDLHLPPLGGTAGVSLDFATMLDSVPGLTLALPVFGIFALFATFYKVALMAPDDFRQGMEPYVRGNYDPVQAKAYYSRHQLLVIQRASQVFRLSNGFFVGLLYDKYILKDEEKNRSKRAQELLTLVTGLGPTAIKIGQALSVRPDLIPAEYAKALATLQDSVPPFDGKAAKSILRKELGQEKYSHLKDFPFMTKNSGPVASASIGQVYRGFIDKREVAVKVQRPNVLAEIALDLHLVREFAPFYKKLTGAASDLQGLADEWGRGFIAELDYREEAENTIRFTEEMRKRKLDSVSAPAVVTAYSTEQVLVTEWIDGVRIDKSTPDDVPRLCAVALNAYLVMLLELQSLHCDPHPGNLLVTPEGKLFILDFGMTLDIDPSLQYSLLEFVAHLTSNDYDKIADDFVALGFLKEEKLDFVKRSGLLEPLKYFFKQASEGGGAKQVRARIFAEYREKYPGLSDDDLRIEMRSEMKVRVNQIAEREGAVTGITVEVEELQRKNRDSFKIPEWFLYTSRAFLTLEGVSLQADENFSIVKSCFPYVAKRLVGDDSPRAQNALRELLYGAENQIDSSRIIDLAGGFSTYTTTSKNTGPKLAPALNNGLVLAEESNHRLSPAVRREKLAETQASVALAKDSADILLRRDGNLVQTLLVEESVRATSARVKDDLRNVLVDGPQRFRDSLPLGVGSFLPPLPFESQLSPFLGKTEGEVNAQRLAEKLLSLVSRQQLEKIQGDDTNISPANGDAGGDAPPGLNALLEDLDPEQLALLSRELRESAPKYVPLVGVLGAKFAESLLQTAATNIDAGLAKSSDAVTTATARGLSTVARRGAGILSDRVINSGSDGSR